MKQRGGANALGLPLDGGTVGKLRVFEVLDGGEMLVDQGGVGERPEMLSRLQFGGIRRQEEQMHMLRHPQSEAGVPPGAVKHQHNLLVWASTHLTCELGQFDFKHGNADGGGQMKERPTGGGMDKADQVAPGKAVLHRGDGPLPNRSPDPPQEWFQADAMLVSGPDLDAGVGKRGGDRLDKRP